jgi:LCP family protein required for cell wall assembly
VNPRLAGGQRRSRLTWRRAISLVVLTLLLGVIAYGGWIGWRIWQLENTIVVQLPPSPTEEPVALVDGLTETPEPTPGIGTPTHPPRPTRVAQATLTPDLTKQLPPGRVNILLLGTDGRSIDPTTPSRSDTLILFTVDTVKKTAGILSIPRDLLMTIPGFGVRKINAAYAIGEFNQLPGGGQALAVQTISRFFSKNMGGSIPIKYYVTVNFDGFEKVVDTIGGIDINVPEEIDDPAYPTPWYGTEHVHFDAGWQHMDGATALKYARTRHADSDFGRIQRQQQVILAVRQKALGLNLLPQLPSLIDQFAGMVETNMDFNTQMGFAQLAASIKSTDIYTARIGSNLVYSVNDPYESKPGVPVEALDLNWDAARPMLDEFFGRTLQANSLPKTTGTPSPPSKSRTPVPTLTAAPPPRPPSRSR